VSPSARRLLDILGTRGVGRRHPVPTKALAAELGVPHRTVGELVAEAIGDEALIGSSCDAARPGYFLIQDLDDLEEGTRHIRARALASLKRVSVLRRSARERFGPRALSLFDLEAEGAA
jgi:hypothetical protein